MSAVRFKVQRQLADEAAKDLAEAAFPDFEAAYRRATSFVRICDRNWPAWRRHRCVRIVQVADGEESVVWSTGPRGRTRRRRGPRRRGRHDGYD